MLYVVERNKARLSFFNISKYEVHGLLSRLAKD